MNHYFPHRIYSCSYNDDIIIYLTLRFHRSGLRVRNPSIFVFYWLFQMKNSSRRGTVTERSAW